jgi:hypothetical protein
VSVVEGVAVEATVRALVDGKLPVEGAAVGIDSGTVVETAVALSLGAAVGMAAAGGE